MPERMDQLANLYFAHRLWEEVPHIRWLMIVLLGAAVVVSIANARKYHI